MESPRSTYRASPWRAFQTPGYAPLWSGAFVSSIGTWMERIAVGVFVAQVTGKASLSGLSAAFLYFPALFLAPLGGVIADRVERRSYLLIVTAAQAVIAGVISLLAFREQLTIPWLMVLMFLTGSAATMCGPAFNALLTELVPAESLSSALFLNSGQFNLARMIGPVLAAAVLAVGGVRWCFAFNAASFFAVLIAVAVVRGEAAAPPAD